MKMDDQQVWFNVAVTAGLGATAAQKIAQYLDRGRLPASALADLDQSALQTEVGLTAGVAVALDSQLRDPRVLPILPSGAVLLTPADERYPGDRLLSGNPPLAPLLSATGDTSLLTSAGPSLSIAGSRDTPEEILEAVHGLAREASDSGWRVVSGLARGVDSAAHQGAMLGRTGTIGVLASGIGNTDRSWMPDDLDNACVVSEFAPMDPWTGTRAMQRNATIASLGDRVLVAASGTSGGSWEMAQLCLRRKKPLMVLDLPATVAPGNQTLIRAGATAVDPGTITTALDELGGPATLFD